MPPHLQRCQGLAVNDYSVTLGRLEAGALLQRRIFDPPKADLRPRLSLN